MDRSVTVNLIAVSYEKDAYGIQRPAEASRQVYAQMRSITRQEFFEGGRNGLNPAYRFDIFAPDYEGETILEYNGERLAIYRTYYSRNDTLELYTERKGGING